MKFHTSQEGNITQLQIGVEKLDSKVAPELKSQFILLANDEQSGHLLVDLSQVAFADSSGLSALLLAHRLYRETERKLIFHSVTDRIMKLIEISQLTPVFSIASDAQEANALVN